MVTWAQLGILATIAKWWSAIWNFFKGKPTATQTVSNVNSPNATTIQNVGGTVNLGPTEQEKKETAAHLDYARAKPELDRLYTSPKAKTIDEWKKEFKVAKFRDWLEMIAKSNDTVTPMEEIQTPPHNYVSLPKAYRIGADMGVTWQMGFNDYVAQIQRWIDVGVLQKRMREPSNGDQEAVMNQMLGRTGRVPCVQLTQSGWDLLDKWAQD